MNSRFTGLLLIIVLVVVGVLFFFQGGMLDGVNKDTYQGVVLTSGETYFGKLDSSSSGFLRLSDIYFLSRNNDVQPGQPTLVLNRFDTQPHGTQDDIYVNRKNVVYWYNVNAGSELFGDIGLMKSGKSDAPVIEQPTAEPK